MDKKIVHELQDMSYLSWAKVRKSSGTAGSFLKAYDDFGTKKRYYKLSNYNIGVGIVGHESVNEIIVDRLLTLLGVPHLGYQLLHANVVVDETVYDTYLCMSYDFKESADSKIALDTYYEIEHLRGENMMDFCVRSGWEEYIYQMLVVDFLILNRDRHGANIEVLKNAKNKTIRLAPLFDHGLSLVFSCLTEEAIRNFDVMRDVRVRCCVGSNSAQEDLKLIPKDKKPKLHMLKENDRSVLMEGLETVLPQLWQDKIWEMIWKRWRVYESLCN